MVIVGCQIRAITTYLCLYAYFFNQFLLSSHLIFTPLALPISEDLSFIEWQMLSLNLLNNKFNLNNQVTGLPEIEHTCESKLFKDLDKKYIWHPFTQMQTAENPLAITKGKGSLLFDKKGGCVSFLAR